MELNCQIKWQEINLFNVNCSHTNNSRLEIDEHGTRDMLALGSLAEEGTEGVIAAAILHRLTIDQTIGLDAMLKAIELPAGIADLDSGLADVD